MNNTETIEDLRKVKSMFNEQQELAHFGSWEWDIESGEIYWSDEMYRIYGVDKDTFHPTRESITAFKHPDEPKKFVSNCILDGKNPIEHEYRIIRPDGEIRDILTYIKTEYDKTGRPLRATGTIQDITSQKQAEDRLRESERKYRELVKYAPAGIYEADFQTRRFLSVNDIICQMTGYSREEMLEMNLADILDEQSKMTFQARADQWRDGAEPDQSVDYKVVAKDGRKIDVLLNVNFTKDEYGKPLGATVIGYEITGRKKAEHELELQAHLLSGVHEAIAATDEKYIITYWNAMAEKMYGWTAVEAIGQYAPGLLKTELPGILPDEAIEKMFNDDSFDGEVIYHHKDGRSIYSEVHTKILRNPMNEFAGTVSSFRDITERKKAEKELALRAYLLDSVHDAVCAIDEKSAFSYWNSMAEEISGRTAEEIIGQPDDEVIRIVAPETVWNGALEDISNKGFFTAEVKGRHKDGTIRYVDVSAQLLNLPGEQFKGAVASFRDITERKKAEEQLSFQAHLLANVHDAICAIDGNYTVSYWNKTAEEISGWTAAELAGKSSTELFEIMVPGVNSEELFADLHKEGFLTMELQGRHKDGTTRYVDASVKLLDCEPGEYGGAVATFRDITERKQMEEQLLFQSHVLASVQDGICAVDENSTISYWNIIAEKILGWKAGEIIGKSSKEILHTLVPESSWDEIIANLSEDFTYAGIFKVRCKCGHVKYLDVRTRSVRNQQGEYRGTVASFRDISERRQMEEDLLKANETLELALKCADMVVWDGDFDSEKTNWSRECKLLFGLDPDRDVDFEDFLALMHPDDLMQLTSQFEDAIQDRGSFHVEMRLARENEATRWVGAHGRCIMDENGYPVRLTGVATDITERKAEEERHKILYEIAGELLASEQPQQIIHKLCLKVMNFLDCDVYFNYLVCAEELLHLNASAGLTDAEKTEFEYIRSGEVLCGFVARDRRRIVASYIQDGNDEETASLKAMGIRAYACHPLVCQNKVAGTLAFCTRCKNTFSDRDIALMQTVADHVAIALDRENDENSIKQMNEQLIKKGQLVTDFFTNISHEFKTPLSVILIQLELMNLYLDDTRKVKEFISAATQNSYRLTRLVGNLLDITKIDAGYMKVRLVKSDMVELVRNICESVYSYANARSLLLTFKSTLPYRLMPTDSDKMERIMLNLLSNAIKHTGRGGKITVEVEGRRGGGATISVADTGEGIPEDKMKTVFDRFAQVDTSLTRRNEGCGIGLALVKALVEMLGGNIKAESLVGRGSTFTIELPLIKTASGGSNPIQIEGYDLSKKTAMELSDINIF